MGRLGRAVMHFVKISQDLEPTFETLKTKKVKGLLASHAIWMEWLGDEFEEQDVLTRERLGELRPLFQKASERETSVWLGELRSLRALINFSEEEEGVSFKEWCESEAALLPCSIPQLVLPVWNDDKAQELAEKYAVGLNGEKDENGISKILKTPKAKELAEWYLLDFMFGLCLAYHYLRGSRPVFEEGGKIEQFDAVEPLVCIIKTAELRGRLLGSMEKLDRPAKPSLSQDHRKMLIVAEAIAENPKATDSTVKMKIAAKSVVVTPNHEAISGTQQGQWLKAFRDDLSEDKQQALFEEVRQNQLKQK